MPLATITSEEFDARLAQSTERMCQKNLMLQEYVAVLEVVVALCSALLKHLEANKTGKI